VCGDGWWCVEWCCGLWAERSGAVLLGRIPNVYVLRFASFILSHDFDVLLKACDLIVDTRSLAARALLKRASTYYIAL